MYLPKAIKKVLGIRSYCNYSPGYCSLTTVIYTQPRFILMTTRGRIKYKFNGVFKTGFKDECDSNYSCYICILFCTNL